MPESFPWLALDTDEEIVWSGHPRLHVVLWIAIPALAVPGSLVVIWPTALSAFVGVLVWVACSYLAYVYVTNIDYVISTKYVYSKRGALGRSVTQISLYNIQDTTLSQGIFGTRSDFGTISFSTAGGEGTTLAFHMIDEPSTVKSTVDHQIATAQKTAESGEEPSNVESVDTLLTELRATRKAAQRIDRELKQGGHQS